MRSRFCFILLLLVSFYSKSDDDFCEYFPEPAQGWVTGASDSILTMTNSGSNNGGESDSYIHGWSAGFISANTTSANFNGKSISILKTGFDKTTDQWQLYNSGDACEDSACSVGDDDAQVDTRKAITPTPINADFSSNTTLSFDGGDYKTKCVDSSLCRYSTDPTSGSDLVEITANLSSLNVGGQSAGHLIVEFQDGISIEKFISTRGGTDVEVRFLDNSTVTFGTFTLGGGNGNSFTFGEMAWINVVTSWSLDNSVVITTSNPVVIYAPDASFSISTNNTDFYGYILAKKVTFNNPITIHGSVTSNNLIMNSGVKILGDGSCSPPPPNTTYTLDVTPTNQFSLLCQTPEVTYTVYNEDGTVATDYPGTITATYPSGLTPLEPTVGSKNSNYIYKHNQGVVTVPVKSDTLAEYTVQAQLTDDSGVTDSGNVLFGPYQFDVELVKAVAAHPTAFNVQVLACKNDKVTPVKGYSGKKKLTASDINLTKPTEAQGAINGDLKVSATESNNDSDTDVTLEFSEDAKATGYLTYQESGSLNFLLTDPNFVCPADYDGCDITPDGDGTDGGDGTDSDSFSTLQGLVNVDVRPWTFAICDASGKALPNVNTNGGDSDRGVAYKAAGEAFKLQVKPIVWQSGGSLTDPVDVNGYCDTDITQNFFVTDAPMATVQVDSKLDTPKDGRLNGGLIFNNDIDKFGAERKHDAGVGSGTQQYYDYDDVRWREVGSITATADTLGNYLGMDINQGYSNIGRFYPHHLEIEDNQWDYLPGHSGFAYMNQPFPMGYTVVAMNKDGNETQNYGFFTEDLLAKLKIVAVDTDNNNADLVDRFDTGTAATDTGWSKEGSASERTAQYLYSTDNFMFVKNQVSSSPYASQPDGPYTDSNALWGILVTDETVDHVNFDFINETSFKINNVGEDVAQLNEQPDFRYGRMALDSVGGPIGGPIGVPLRVEYWDGDSFITNIDDSGSEFKTSVYYVMSNVPNSSAKFLDVGTNKVTNGKSSVIKAEQSTSGRETVRLFLRQGNDLTGYGNRPKPADDPDLNATMTGWSDPHDIGQPWLQFNWRDFGDEDPSAVIIFGAYRGNDRIIYRGEPNLVSH